MFIKKEFAPVTITIDNQKELEQLRVLLRRARDYKQHALRSSLFSREATDEAEQMAHYLLEKIQ